MKLTAVLALSVFSFSALATTVNNINFTNLPTASKDYFTAVDYESQVRPAAAIMKADCLKDKAKAEAMVLASGSKIFASSGCEVNVTPGYDADQGGYVPWKVSTRFEVLFK